MLDASGADNSQGNIGRENRLQDGVSRLETVPCPCGDGELVPPQFRRTIVTTAGELVVHCVTCSIHTVS